MAKATAVSSDASILQEAEDDDLFSLDFTDPDKLAKITAAEEANADVVEWSLEPLSILSAVETGEADAEVEAALQSASDIGAIETIEAIEAIKAEAAPVFPLQHLDELSEAAVTAFAAGRLETARQILADACQSGAATDAHWLMLFDLYRLLNDQPAFEQLVPDYLVAMEKSAPTWNNRQALQTQSAQSAAAATATSAATAERRASVALTGTLNARNRPQFAKLLEVAKTRSLLKLGLEGIQDVDNGGSALLLETLQQLQQGDCELVLEGSLHLADLLTQKIRREDGQPADNAAAWLLLLELYQHLDEAAAFEQLALDYAVTFEVSPPSWIEPRQRRKKPEKPGKQKTANASKAQKVQQTQQVQQAQSDAWSFSGELLQADAAVFSALKSADEASTAASAAIEERVVDFSNVRRMDEDSAMALRQVLNELAQARQQQQQTSPLPGVRLTGCHRLLAALLEMAGVGQLARIELQR